MNIREGVACIHMGNAQVCWGGVGELQLHNPYTLLNFLNKTGGPVLGFAFIKV